MRTFTSVILFTVCCLPVTAQQFEIKDYSLRDYKAPEIKYRRLDIGTYMSGNGADVESYSSFDGAGNAFINYFEYLNTPGGFQGGINTGLKIGGSVFSSGLDTIEINRSGFNSFLYYVDQNRWYGSGKGFFGMHTMFDYTLNTSQNATNTQNGYSTSHILNLTWYISIGSGRIEPVAPARKAMDILLSLEKYNRLARNPDAATIDSLAHVANSVLYKRFFDRRFKRIYQLEELDKSLRETGLVTNTDMVYAANLSDIWSFAFNFSRGAGNRWEYGIIPVFRLIDKTEYQNSKVYNKLYNYGIYGYVSWNHLVPVNYKWQSDIMIDLNGGWQEYNPGTSGNNVLNDQFESKFSELLNVSWSVGYFPNTRTYLGITAYARGSLTQRVSGEAAFLAGAHTGLDFRSYFYISPPFRISFYAGIGYSTTDYSADTPMPYWNTSADAMQFSMEIPNRIVWPHLINFQPQTGVNSLRYNFGLTLSYAIF